MVWFITSPLLQLTAARTWRIVQVPQFILSRWPESSVIVTQPRRIAATSIAKRVATEMRAGRVGGLVGYQIGMKSELSASTRVLFCTTGILLRRLVTNKEKSASEFSHIILDETHELGAILKLWVES